MEHKTPLRAFFVEIFAPAPRELYTTGNTIVNGRPTSRTFPLLEECASLITWVEQHRNDDRANLYFRPGLMAAPPATNGGRGLEKDTVGATALWADLDIYRPEVSVSAEEALAVLLAGEHDVPVPNMVIHSGGGLQAYWMLDTFCTNLEALKGRNKWIQESLKMLGADAVSNLDRILRVPTTWNHKKIPRRPVEIQHFCAEHRYTLGDFGYMTTRVYPSASPTPPVAATPLPEDFLLRLRARSALMADLIENEALARERRAAVSEDGVFDHSKNDWSIARGLLRMGYSESDVRAVLTHPTWLSGTKFRERGSDQGLVYVNTTIAKAQQKLLEVNPNRFFEGRTFIVQRMLDYLDTLDAHFLWVGAELWYYSHGAFRPDAADYIRHQVALVLGDRWASRHAEETVKRRMHLDFPDLEERKRNLTSPVRHTLRNVWLNVENGMLNLAQREMRTHSPDDESLYQLPVQYSSAHVKEVRTGVERFVGDILPADCVPAWWEWMGYHLLQDCRYRKALMVIGPRYSGKSTLLGLLERFLGPHNYASIPLQDICDDRFSSSGLEGKLANIYNDLDMTEITRPGNLKVHVSGERVSIEKKYLPRYEIFLTAKHSYSANDFLPVTDPDDAYISRWLVLPAPFQFSDERGEKREANFQALDQVTTPEHLSVVLGLALDGLVRLNDAKHFTYGASMIEMQHQFHASLDRVYAFLSEQTVRDPSGFIPKDVLLHVFQSYCTGTYRGGAGTMGSNKFYRRVKALAPEMGMVEARRKTEHSIQDTGYEGRRLLTTATAHVRGSLQLVKASS